MTACWATAFETGKPNSAAERTIERREVLAEEIRVMVAAEEIDLVDRAVSGWAIDSGAKLGQAVRTNVKLSVKLL